MPSSFAYHVQACTNHFRRGGGALQFSIFRERGGRDVMLRPEAPTIELPGAVKIETILGLNYLDT